MTKRVEPSISESAFSCPHCGALSAQQWFHLKADSLPPKRKIPFIADASILERLDEADFGSEQREKYRRYLERAVRGDLFLDRDEDGTYLRLSVVNLHISHCFNCSELALWMHDRLLHPSGRAGVEPNDDLSQEIKWDFEEARTILDQSPRGAAALLRLALQKLCKQLGESGDNIDADIASLVGKGLNPIIQKSLDVVRVIGNESVHPGTLDLRDDRDTALKLFGLINAIAQQMITHPREVEELYGKLPEAKRAGIDARNARAIKKTRPDD